ncbi:MAG: D-alanyl-D-alanine carboxypeptidase [Alphaproteobacteria bacterium]|nr:D-alanyl-D-alanine carboxypeptidase [Alphaproteobacteria bacterium]
MTGLSDFQVLAYQRIGAVFAALVLALGLILFTGSINPASARPSRATIVVDWQSGRVMSAYKADKLHAPASLTKVMTLYLVFEALASKRLKIDQSLKISRRAQFARPSRLGLRAGGTITVRQAILALVTKSANDAAVVLAEALGGSEANFGRIMTAKARALGMLRTTFRNASGLPARGQLTTARDLAILARAIISKYPQHYHYFSTRAFVYRGRVYRNHNRLLGRYPGVDGLKTGYVRASGHNLIVSARNKTGRRVIAIVLGGRSRRDRDWRMTAMLNRSFGKQSMYAAANPKGTSTVLVNRTRAETLKPTLRLTARLNSVRKTSSFVPRRYRRYSVQVGAYRSHRHARRAAYRAARRLPQFRYARRRIVRSRSGRIYMARLQGFSRKQAYSACRTLRRAKQHCAVYGPRRYRRSRS